MKNSFQSAPADSSVWASNQPSRPVTADRKWSIPITLYFLMIAFPIEYGLGPLHMSGIRTLLILWFVPCMLGLLSGRFGRVIWPDALLFILAIWVIGTMFVNSPNQALSFGGSVAVELFGGYLLARAYVRTADDFAFVCKLIFFVVIFSLPFAVYESQTGVAPIPVLINKLPFFSSFADYFNPIDGRRLGLERSQVIFSHPIHYGLFCSTAVSLIFVGFKGRINDGKRYFIGFLMLLGVFFSISSGAVLPVVLQIGLIFWAWLFAQNERRWIYLLILIAIAYVVVDMISNRTPITVFLSYATFSEENAYGRIDIFDWGMKNVWDRPFIGRGLNDWFRAWYMHSGSMDNFWLVCAVRYGIPGFLLAAVSYATILWKVMGRKFEEGSTLWKFRRAWVFTMIGLALTLATVDVWATMLSYVFFMLGAGVWLMTIEPEQSDQEAPVSAPTDPRGTVRFTRFP